MSFQGINGVRLTGFSLREALNEVRLLMEAESEGAEERCSSLHRHYQTLARDYKRLEKRLVECQRKQLEVCTFSQPLAIDKVVSLSNVLIRLSLEKSFHAIIIL